MAPAGAPAPRRWTPDSLGELGRAFQGPCVLAAAAELDVFSRLARTPRSAARLARALRCDVRGMTVLLDALTALGLLAKSRAGLYLCAPGVAAAMGSGPGRAGLLPGLRHLANCLRRWADLARVVKSGAPGPRRASILGPAADTASFIGAMHAFSSPVADGLVREVRPKRFKLLLDVGGGPGTWTISFLRGRPEARAILFDLPAVIPLARRRIAEAGLAGRVRFAAGDYLRDPLPRGADLAWLSAIAHQNSRARNRRLYSSIRRALAPGATLLLRDIVMEESRTRPPAGALFAVNMLTATAGGGTFTFDEYRADLEASGFTAVRLVRRDVMTGVRP